MKGKRIINNLQKSFPELSMVWRGEVFPKTVVYSMYIKDTFLGMFYINKNYSITLIVGHKRYEIKPKERINLYRFLNEEILNEREKISIWLK